MVIFILIKYGLKSKIIIFFIIVSILFWLSGFLLSELINYSVDSFINFINHPLFYVFIVLFFIGFFVFIRLLFRVLKISKILIYYVLFSFIITLINIILDIIIVFPRYKISFFSYPITYLGYILMFFTAYLCFIYENRKV